MMYYLIKNKLEKCAQEEVRQAAEPFVAVISLDDWDKLRDMFHVDIDMGMNPAVIHNTKAVVNHGALTGNLAILDRKDLSGPRKKFSFVLIKRGIIFIDDTGTAGRMTEEICRTKEWTAPCLERFFYDFLEQIIHNDMDMLENYERRLYTLEQEILGDKDTGYLKRLNRIRTEMRELLIHYEQLISFAGELEENNNGFFAEENLRYFHMFGNRITRLHDIASSVRDYTAQLNDLSRSQADLKMNRIMTALTVITAIFMPLTLIVGWYGMNFIFMPELASPLGYPAVIAVSLLIVVGGLLYFRKKKWL